MSLQWTASRFVLSGILLATSFVSALFLLRRQEGPGEPIAMAVEFTNHAAAAYVARDAGWYEAWGLEISSYRSYVTGMALASALARGDIQAAYMCLVPAISAYANAGVRIKIVAGTHRYGYALVADPEVVTTVRDLEKPDVRTGCVREGGTVDVLLNRTVDAFRLDRRAVLERVRRMNPPRMLLAIRSGQLDAAFLPEHWAGMAEEQGLRMLLTAQEIWPDMPGSVLIANEELTREAPEAVRALVAVNERATAWIQDHPLESARVLSGALSVAGETALPTGAEPIAQPDVSLATMCSSMGRLEYTTRISVADVQEVIDYVARLGYIPRPFSAEEIVDLRFGQ